VELRLLGGRGQARRVDLFLELDRTRRASYNVPKFQRYDAFITGWALALDRYRVLGEPPIVLFVCEDAERAWAFARAADEAVTGRIATRGRPESEWNHLGRKRMFFCAERDLHHGTLRCLKLPEWPPAVRRQVEGRHGRKPREVEFTQVGLLGGDELVRKARILLRG
jgi:hypothetical protein